MTADVPTARTRDSEKIREMNGKERFTAVKAAPDTPLATKRESTMVYNAYTHCVIKDGTAYLKNVCFRHFFDDNMM